MVVRMNEELFQSIVSDLVENALKYGRNRVSVQAEEAGGFIKLRIEDDGPGIPAEERKHLFEPFGRGKGEVKKGYELGLAIVKASVDARQGAIVLGESLMDGLSVEVSLPTTA